jgi:hypothetical protein
MRNDAEESANKATLSVCFKARSAKSLQNNTNYDSGRLLEGVELDSLASTQILVITSNRYTMRYSRHQSINGNSV